MFCIFPIYRRGDICTSAAMSVNAAGSSTAVRVPGYVACEMKSLALLVALGGAAFIGGVYGAEENAEALKQRVIALARTVGAEDYAFTRTARVEQIAGEKKQTRATVERYDPRKPADQRWNIVSVDGRAPTTDELKNHRKESPKRRVAHYGRVANYFGAESTTTAGQSGRTIFRFAQLPKESLVVNNNDFSSSAVAEATVDASGAVPFVEQVRFTLTKPVRLMLVAKVERFESITRYRVLADGKPVPVEQVSEMSGSMPGKVGRIKTLLTYSDHTRAR